MAEPAPTPDTAARSLAAVAGVLVDVQLAVIAAAAIVDGITGPRVVHLVTLLAALCPPSVRLAGRGRPTAGARAWTQVGLDVVTAVAVLATVGSDSLVLVYIATTVAVCSLDRGPLGALLATGVLAGVHALAAVGLTAAGDAPVGVLVVVVRIGLLGVTALGALRLREVILQRDRLNAAYAALEEQRLREAERTRLAREMHDSLAKSLHGMRLLAGHLASRLERERHPLAEQADLLASSVEHGLAEARRIIHNLREVPVGSLREHLGRVVPAWSAEHGLPADLDLPPGDPALSLSAREELAKAVAELLENVARHAGAGRVRVTLAEEAGAVRVTVADDGRGMPAPDLHALYRDGHFGLVGVSERMARVGGRVDVDVPAGGGTAVSLQVPSLVPDAAAGAAPDAAPDAAAGCADAVAGVVPVAVDVSLPDPVAVSGARNERRRGSRRPSNCTGGSVNRR